VREIVFSAVAESNRTKEAFFKANVAAVEEAARRLAGCFASGHKLLIFGNGGSAADAQHIAAEFVNRFTVERKPLAALALTTDTSILTCIANDYSFRDIFSKQIRALGERGDVALGISTSGNSPNVIAGLETAKDLDMYTIGLAGGDGGTLSNRCDLSLVVQSGETPRIQETHIVFGHILCELTDRILFPELFGDEASVLPEGDDSLSAGGS